MTRPSTRPSTRQNRSKIYDSNEHGTVVEGWLKRQRRQESDKKNVWNLHQKGIDFMNEWDFEGICPFFLSNMNLFKFKHPSVSKIELFIAFPKRLEI